MTTKVFVSFLVITSLAFGGGYWVAQKKAAPSPVVEQTPALTKGASPKAPNDLPVLRQKKRADGKAVAPAVKDNKLTVDEIEARIREMNVSGWNYGGRKRFMDLQKMLESVDPADMSRLLAFVEKTGSRNMKDSMRAMLLGKWAETDLHGAMAYANALPTKQARENAIMQVVQSWAEKDASAALEWAKQLPKGSLRSQVMSGAIGSLAAKDPAAAFELMKDNETGNHNRWGGGMYQIFNVWADKDPAAAAAKATEALTGQQRSQAYQSIAGVWAAKDPQAALKWAETLGGQDKRNSISSIVSAWAGSDVNSASLWVQNLPEGTTKQQALSTLGSQWSQNDPAAAIAYAQNLPAGTGKNNMLGTVLGQWAQQDATAAMKYV
ncbi:MAG: hypothetical protein ABI042_14010, partial [Verrucomicrobiota bacterium]